MSNIKEILLYTISLLNEKEIKVGKTLLQKILYFSLDEAFVKENYRPHFYGPYSSLVQDTIDNMIYSNKLNVDYSVGIDKAQPTPNITFSQEFNPSININEDIKSKICKIIEYYKNNNFNLSDISLLSKIDILTNDYKDISFQEVKSISKLYDWQQITKMNENDFNNFKSKLIDFKNHI